MQQGMTIGGLSSAQTATPRMGKRWIWGSLIGCVLLVFLVVAIAVGIWAYRVYTYYTIDLPRHVQQQRQYLRYQANHAAILAECRLVHANPGAYTTGNPFQVPSNLPPTLAALQLKCFSIEPTGVRFDVGDHEADIGGFFAEVNPSTTQPGVAPAPPAPAFPGAVQLIPGLWYWDMSRP
jgi:hypothetical protein